MITSVSVDSIDVQQAKQAVAAKFGKVPQVPSDFAALSLAIEKSVGQSLNADTLSRIWGYKTGYSSVRKTTLDILRAYANARVESDFVHTEVIHADDMSIGQQLQLAWLPDRTCTIEYQGDYRWKVVAVVNSKLQLGDTFSCRSFAQGEPLLVDYLCTKNGVFDAYQIGGQTGLTAILTSTSGEPLSA